MNKKDEQKFGLYVFLGFGGMLGLLLGAVNGNLFTGFWIGALVGLALGWFAAAAMFQQSKKQ